MIQTSLAAVALAFAIASGPFAAPALAQTPAHGHADETDGVHGMLLFGETEVYASHLPLYRAPHDWQMILAVRLLPGDGALSDPQAAYRRDVRESGERIYTLEPERFAHSVLAGVAEGRPVRFRATIYRGHFERGGTSILRDVVVEVTRVVERRRLDAAEADGDEARYLLFGGGGSAFLAHRVAGAPDFDQVMAIDLPAGAFTPDELARGVAVIVTDHAAGDPLREDASVRLRAGDGKTVDARIRRQFYLEHGDLAAP